jgi:Ti-type conjugative transfer relaxase TraA
MAIYHLSGSIISRSQGRSAVAAAAYRSGEKLADEQQGMTHDYTKKQDVVYTEIFLPEGAPEEFKRREVLWNAVEKNEKRKDAQLAREFTISLPRELTIEQNKALITEFVTHEFVRKGMIADVCFHNDVMKDGNRQPHVHVMLTLREVNEEGFGKKVRDWNNKELLLHWRESWSNSANHHLALNGFDVQIDHRSNEARGIELEPQYKIGPSASEERMARFEDHQRIARENGVLLLERPEMALDALTKEQSTFTHKDLARFIHRHTENAEQFNLVFAKVKESKELVFLGLDTKNQQRFSTRDMLNCEASMMCAAESLDKRLSHKVSDKITEEVKATRSLSIEQETALHYLTAKGDLKSLVGYAGTGKSYLLGAAREAWEASGYRVHGTALSGIAALNLSKSSGIESRTIASLFYRLDKDMLHWDARDILVVDEAGMLGTRTMERLVREAQSAGAKLVLMGDWQQLQAIEAGAPFRAIAENYQYAELNQIRRQTTPWQVEASLNCALGAVDKALAAYQEHDHVHQFRYQQEAKEQLITLWNDARIANSKESQIILAYTRQDVKELNELARSQKRKDGELGDDVLFDTERGARYFAVNDRVYFLKREDSLSVINGTLGTISSINEKTGVIEVALDCEEASQKPQSVSVNTVHYQYLEHGYAATVYKAQGVTVDRSYVLPSKHYDAHSAYVAMTRHRKSCDVFVSREAFPSEKILINTLSRNRAKDITMDYTQMDAEFARQRSVALPRAPQEQSISPEQYFRQSEREVERLMNQVMGKEAQALNTRLDVFEAQFRKENKDAAQQIDCLLAGSEADKVKSAQVTSALKQKNHELSRQLEDGEKNKVKQRERSLDREIDF